RQFAVVARAVGADPVPLDRREAETIFRDLRTYLTASPAAREVADLVLRQRPQGAPPAVQAMLGAEAVALLPPFARSMLGLERPGLAALPARAATWGMGKTLRWAFRQFWASGGGSSNRSTKASARLRSPSITRPLSASSAPTATPA
ncbi:MAG: oxygenase MpaB family protein, partial [Pseudomonadota bacterium]|nr:oxygenase MpaB family protein [Pseudomonadota bacterium]